MERAPKESDDSHSVKSIKLWQCFGSTYPKNEVVFFGQIILLYVVVIAAIVNLSYPALAESRSALWISLLSSSIGYILPHPTFKTSRGLAPAQKP